MEKGYERQLNISYHGQQRMQQRGRISPEAIRYAVKCGHREYRQGRIFCFIKNSQVYGPRHDSWRGLVVVVAQDGDVITVWRDPDGLSKIRRKSRRRSNRYLLGAKR